MILAPFINRCCIFILFYFSFVCPNWIYNEFFETKPGSKLDVSYHPPRGYNVMGGGDVPSKGRSEQSRWQTLFLWNLLIMTIFSKFKLEANLFRTVWEIFQTSKNLSYLPISLDYLQKMTPTLISSPG